MSNSIEYITDEKGNKTKVILPFESYERLLEDLHDLAVIAERRDGERMNLDDLKADVEVLVHS